MLRTLSARLFTAGVFFVASGLPAVSGAQDSVARQSYVGPGVLLRPAYEGARNERAQIIPLLRLYTNHLFLRTTQGMLEGGARIKPLRGVAIGLQVAYESGRLSDESTFLSQHNVEDIDAGASIGAHAEADWNVGPAPFNALLRYRRNVAAERGAQADFRLSAGVLAVGRLKAGVFGQLTWSDSAASQNYFGLTNVQASAAGLPPFQTGGGPRYTAFGLLASFDVTHRFVLLFSSGPQFVQGGAINSPLVEERRNMYASVGIAYRF